MLGELYAVSTPANQCESFIIAGTPQPCRFPGSPIELDAEGIQNWSYPVCSFEDRLECLCSRGLSAP
jgi:hypothetical protein